MKFFNFVCGKLVDSFAKELAKDFAKACPLTGAINGKRDPGKQAEKALADIFKRASSFRQEQRLGVFKRARLAKKFQDELRALGYDADMVNRVTTALVTNALSAAK